MFDLRRPCITCPFRKGQGQLFGLHRARLEEIRRAPAFQCHKTVVYLDDGGHEQGDHAQQCAGLMAVLAKEGWENQIMQVGSRLGHLQLDRLDPEHEAYESWQGVLDAHSIG